MGSGEGLKYMRVGSHSCKYYVPNMDLVLRQVARVKNERGRGLKGEGGGG